MSKISALALFGIPRERHCHRTFDKLWKGVVLFEMLHYFCSALLE